MTAICAVAFSLPRYAADMYLEAVIDHVEIGSTEFVATDDLDETGARLEFKDVLVTEENVEELKGLRREEYGHMKSGLSIGIVIYCAIVSAIAFLFVPVVSLTLSIKGTRKGVWDAVIYLFLLFVTAGLLLVVVAFGSFITIQQVIPYLFGLGMTLVVAAMFPLYVSRRLGIRLVNKRDCRQRRIEISAEPS